jgi:hypothetical protein
MAFNLGLRVERAYLLGRVHCAVPAHKNSVPALRRGVAARNQARRLPGYRPRKDGPKVRLYSRPGNDLTYRFPSIVESLARLRSRSCIIDGEAVGRPVPGTVPDFAKQCVGHRRNLVHL